MCQFHLINLATINPRLFMCATSEDGEMSIRETISVLYKRAFTGQPQKSRPVQHFGNVDAIKRTGFSGRSN
jgi:hypothetical protein